MINKFRGNCKACGTPVPAYKGTATKQRFERFWTILCAKHSADHTALTVSNTFYFPSTGKTFYRNKNGTCEDAPCCGCCTI